MSLKFEYFMCTLWSNKDGVSKFQCSLPQNMKLTKVLVLEMEYRDEMKNNSVV